MTSRGTAESQPAHLEETIRILQEELANTNREVLVLTLDLEKRVEERTSELRVTQQELQRANSDLLALTGELETRVAQRTHELAQANATLLREIEERKLAEAKLRAHLGRLHLLHRITRAIGERQDVSGIFRVVIRSVVEDLGVDVAAFYVHETGGGRIRLNSFWAGSVKWMTLGQQEETAIDENGLRWVLQGQLVYEPDIRGSPSEFLQHFARSGLTSMVLVPLVVEGSVMGIVAAVRAREHGFESGDCEFLTQLGEHAALAAHQAHLHESLQRAYDDLHRTQEVMLQQERLRALGQMASGVAHDINNAISPVALYTDVLLESEPGLSPRVQKYLEITQRAIGDVAHTLARMGAFYRQREAHAVQTPVRLNPLVEQVFDLTRARWKDEAEGRGSAVEVRSELAEFLPPLLGSESEIRDALTNLVFNAVDSMPAGGTLMIRTLARLDQDAARVVVEVRDTGAGMDEETRKKCLEPFFTTKGDRGTGLGLAMVYGMAQRHGADVEIDSAVGEGTAVRLVFPATEAARGVDLPAPIRTARKLRLLVVDDDPLLLRSLRETLESEGHAITSATGGAAGIESFLASQNRADPFDAVITDLGMPHVDGRQVAAAVKSASPATPVVLLTGWGQRLAAEHDVPPNVDRMVNKPPKLSELRAALSDLTQ